MGICDEKKTYVRSQLEYGSVVWGDAAQTYLSRLDTVQNYAVARALGVPKYSSVAAIHAELDVTTLSLRRDSQLLRYARRVGLKTATAHPVSDLFESLRLNPRLRYRISTQNRSLFFCTHQRTNIAPRPARRLSR